ncbi:hypothetical protein [Alteromonas facilis]|uniref:hypothetical protein n=1 Tax=Alteromonas facilis TaxID=2048004 RepID=UPI0013D9E161|nr:hypothetical protein [Alteromonas facilis]
MLSFPEKRKDALKKAESDLTAKRTLSTAELSSYIDTFEKQAIVTATVYPFEKQLNN